MFSVGILAFIFMDVTSHGQEIVAAALERFKHHHAGFGHVVGLFALLAAGFTPGDGRHLGGRAHAAPPARAARPIAGGAPSAGDRAVASPTRRGAPARAPDRDDDRRRDRAAQLRRGPRDRRLGEGRRDRPRDRPDHRLRRCTTRPRASGSSGRSAASGRPGAGSGSPASSAAARRSSAPIVGYQVHSDPLELAFYALAGGAILYVIGEIWTGMRRYGHRTLGLYLLAAGFLAGVATDLIVSYGGG